MKKLLLVLICLTLILSLALVGCGKDDKDTTPSTQSSNTNNQKPQETPTPKEKIELIASKTKVVAGEEIVFTLYLNDVEGVKSAAFRPMFDESAFELVSGKMLITGSVEGFLDGVGAIAFDECVDMSSQRVMQFVLKATQAGIVEDVGCQVSVKAEDDKTIVVTQPLDVTITVE